MTRNEFAALCAEHLIDPAIALENEAIKQALLDKDGDAVIEALETEF